MSTIASPRAGAVRAVALSCLTLLAACGWRFGPPPDAAWAVGRIEGATVEPGLRASVESAFTRALRARGAGGEGPTVDLRLVSADQAPEAAVAGGEGTVGWRATLIVDLAVAGREGCAATLRRDIVWFDAVGPAGVPGERAAALEALAQRIAEAAVDQLVAWGPACR